MLGKLLKHEWIATSRRYLLFYVVLAAMTVLAAIIHAIPVDNILFNIGEFAFLTLYVISLIGVIFCSTGMAVVRFYKNMVSDEGYLTFTLPAKVGQLVFSKFLVAMCCQVLSVLLVTLSLICVYVLGHIGWSELMKGVSFIFESADTLLPVFCFMILISMMYQMLLYYLSIAIGQLFHSHKILAAVIAYCVLAFAFEIIMVVIMFGVCGVVGFEEVVVQMSTTKGMTVFYLISTVWIAVMGAAEYFVICYLLKKKLNLN